MLKIAVYGKGGIGKSTVTSNLAAAFASMGKKVIQIGCDPKADSTINLLGGTTPIPVMNYMREYDEDPERIEDISKIGYGGVLCIETGGPTPGLGCAGRGIIATFSLLEDLELFETYEPDVVLYDVLGDVVCGGFAAPIREGYASKVLIVTSGEKMALYAANNINNAVKNFEDRSYAKVYGIVLNHRNVEKETEKVAEFADLVGLPIVGKIPRSDEITGGPTPGLGCAGRGIIATFSLLEDLELFETYEPDVVLYDVLGDVVCGGFAAPIREGYASKVLIVTSGEKMALYAANNINNAVKNFEDRSYAKVYGIVLNHRNVEKETEKVAEFADLVGLPIVGKIPRSDEITRCEDKGMTVIEGEPESPAAQAFLKLAKELLENAQDTAEEEVW